MNPFTTIAAAVREAIARKVLEATAARQLRDPASLWTPHEATKIRRNRRLLNRALGHRQVKRHLMARLREAGDAV